MTPPIMAPRLDIEPEFRVIGGKAVEVEVGGPETGVAFDVGCEEGSPDSVELPLDGVSKVIAGEIVILADAEAVGVEITRAGVVVVVDRNVTNVVPITAVFVGLWLLDEAAATPSVRFS
jgi:hypothetical protein